MAQKLTMADDIIHKQFHILNTIFLCVVTPRSGLFSHSTLPHLVSLLDAGFACERHSMINAKKI